MLSRQYNDHRHRLRHRFVAVFKSFNDAWADTTTAHGRLMLTVLGDLRPINASKRYSASRKALCKTDLARTYGRRRPAAS
jgi:hypothetical protein